MPKLCLIALLFSLGSTVWAQRVSPGDGFFSVEPPQDWSQTGGGDTLIWLSPGDHATILAVLLDEHGSDSDARNLFQGKGFHVTSSEEKTLHGFRCLYQTGDRHSFNLNLKGAMYYCPVRRGNSRCSVVIVNWSDSESYLPAVNRFLDSLHWDGNVKDDR